MRYLCIHGHCYQPPREDPWLDEVDGEGSAWPYHDWNERIAAECYTPNTAARILDRDGQIAKIVNNYSQTSFDFGPTLLNWLEKHPSTYNSIRRADQESALRFSGHGSAMALAYNHVILPLANSRDKFTQIHWGIQDFVYRFGRQPEGMWLPETAVDLESLDIMSRLGIKFTLLAPSQAIAVRAFGSHDWQDVSGGRVDSTLAHSLRLPSGRSISLFFFNHPVSQSVSFDGLLENGEKFIGRLMGAYSPDRHGDELLNIVTDGEVYGHHHASGEMALAYALDQIAERGLARITNYGEYLERHPPTSEVRVVENSAWSCAHGVDRWRAHCGCNAGHWDWNQRWRGPLRDAFDWLRDMVGALFERAGGEVFHDPWEARNDYIQVVLDRSPKSQARFKRKHLRREVAAHAEINLWRLLELQRHSMLMYTSCGWFFDELSGIETVQVIRHSARVVELVRATLHQDLEPQFLTRLALAKSNLQEQGDGAKIYHKRAKPEQTIDLEVPIAKDQYSMCAGLGALRAVIRRGEWPKPDLESQGPICERIRESGSRDAEAAYIKHNHENGSVGRLLRDLKIRIPGASSVAQRALNSMLRRAFLKERPAPNQIRALGEEARAVGVVLDAATIECICRKTEQLSIRWTASPENIVFLADVKHYVEPLATLGSPITVWAVQNACYKLMRGSFPEMKLRSGQGDRPAQEWVRQFSQLSEMLGVRIP